MIYFFKKYFIKKTTQRGDGGIAAISLQREEQHLPRREKQVKTAGPEKEKWGKPYP